MKQLKFLFIIAAILSTKHCFAQFNDNFSDGNFTENPAWKGDVSKFAVTSGKLKLSAPAVAESSFLSLPSQAIHAGIWQFSVQLDFTPSSTNYAKVYLISDQENMQSSLNGYFVKIGSLTRDVCLYRQNGIVETKIIDGTDDVVNQTAVKALIKVTRSESGEWKLYTDVGLTGAYSQQGTTTDTFNVLSSYFGILCVYTSTRADKFWFDDFVVTGIPIPDTTSPVVFSVNASTATQVDVLFSETLDVSSSEVLSNFSIASIGIPQSAKLRPDQKTVSLSFSTSLTNGTTYALNIKGIKDPVGNVMVATAFNFLFFQPTDVKNKDIIFTELFPDPSPQIGLPNAEFVEIYNRSKSPFNLGGWKLTDGSSTGTFPSSQIMLPGEYWIITSSASVPLFSSFGKTIGLQNFPTLNNDGDAFVLKDANNKTIDSVNYTTDWYRDVDKQQGGWTLELIDPTNPCGEADNWIASDSPTGGTPGMQNDVFANKPDVSPPSVTSVFPETSSLILIKFNEKLDASSLAAATFDLNPVSDVAKVSFVDKTLRTVKVEFVQPLKVRQKYFLEIENVRDCNLNISYPLRIPFGLPEATDSLDLVINEILFNPRSGGVDFVEVFNKSEKYVNLKNWWIGNYVGAVIENQVPIFTDDVLLPPDSLIVFTTSPSIVQSQYLNNGITNLFKTPLPTLADDAGSVALLNAENKIMDEVSYSKDWHSVFVKNEDGVSLERLSVNAASNSSVNWNSASATSGFATPGLPNSQQRMKNEQKSDDAVLVVPEIFIPNNNSNDFVEIRYHFDESPVANVKVFDSMGHLLKTIANNESLGLEGSLRWDGDRDDGAKVRMGYYIVWFEVFNSSGMLSTYRRRVVIASN